VAVFLLEILVGTNDHQLRNLELIIGFNIYEY